MKINRSLQRALMPALACAALALLAVPAHASITYLVNLDTSSIAGNINGPFSLDFQLSDGTGAGDGNNTITLSNFLFTGGTATGTSNPSGGASGDLGSTVSLTDSSFFSELFQTFSAGTTGIQFRVTSSTNVDPGLTPDVFAVTLLDNSLFNIPTNSGSSDGSNILLSVPLDSNLATSLSHVTASSGTGYAAGVSAIATVPEPSRVMFMMLGVCGVAFRRQRRMPA